MNYIRIPALIFLGFLTVACNVSAQSSTRIGEGLEGSVKKRVARGRQVIEEMSAVYSKAPGLFGVAAICEQAAIDVNRKIATMQFSSRAEGEINEVVVFAGREESGSARQVVQCDGERVLCESSKNSSKIVVADIVDGDTLGALVFAGIALQSPEAVLRVAEGLNAAVLRALCLQSGDFPRVADYRLEHPSGSSSVHVITIITRQSEAKVRVRSDSFTLVSITMEISRGPVLSGGPGGMDIPRGVPIRMAADGTIVDGSTKTIYSSTHVLGRPFGEDKTLDLKGKSIVPFFSDLDVRRSQPVPPMKPGSLAASFNLSDIEGIRRKLEDFQGKVVVLDWWADT